MKTITISEQTYEGIKDQLKEKEKVDISSLDDIVGEKLFLRTVTYHFLGKCVKKMGNFIQLEGASWIADSGRFMDFIIEGKINEVEPVGTWFVNLDTVTDFGIWKHELPKEQK